MKTLNELLQNEERVWFKIDKKYRKEFLSFAIKNGCKWMDGDKITMKNNISFCMGIDKDLRMGFVSLILLGVYEQANKVKIYDFKEILGEEKNDKSNNK